MEGVYVANYYENTRELEAYERSRSESMGQDINGGRGKAQPLSRLSPTCAPSLVLRPRRR